MPSRRGGEVGETYTVQPDSPFDRAIAGWPAPNSVGVADHLAFAAARRPPSLSPASSVRSYTGKPTVSSALTHLSAWSCVNAGTTLRHHAALARTAASSF
jgi:hypothetical protein